MRSLRILTALMLMAVIAFLCRPAHAGRFVNVIAITIATDDGAVVAPVEPVTITATPAKKLLSVVAAPVKAVRERRGHFEKLCPGNGRPCFERWVWDEPPLATTPAAACDGDCPCGPDCACEPCECPTGPVAVNPGPERSVLVTGGEKKDRFWIKLRSAPRKFFVRVFSKMQERRAHRQARRGH